MGRCVGYYAERTVARNCYLFQVDHGREQATVEVDSSGQVRQSVGPGNESNRAARCGEQLLLHWRREIASVICEPNSLDRF